MIFRAMFFKSSHEKTEAILSSLPIHRSTFFVLFDRQYVSFHLVSFLRNLCCRLFYVSLKPNIIQNAFGRTMR